MECTQALEEILYRGIMAIVRDGGSMRASCPCGGLKSYMQCCGPLIKGKRLAETAQELMRSRYTAFAKQRSDYLVSTAAGAAAELFRRVPVIDAEVQWVRLEVIDVVRGLEADNSGEVYFRAYYKKKCDQLGRVRIMSERSVFQKIEGRWFYVGEIDAGVK